MCFWNIRLFSIDFQSHPSLLHCNRGSKKTVFKWYRCGINFFQVPGLTEERLEHVGFQVKYIKQDARLVWLRFSSIFTPFWISQKFWPVGSRLGTEAMIVVDNFYGKIITKVVVEQFSGIHGMWNLSFSMTIVSVDTWMWLSLCLSRGQKLQQVWLTGYEYQNTLREIFNF